LNGGIGITEKSDIALLYQFGVGIGYTLLDTIPFYLSGWFK
jgi:hypothetical protein